MRQRSFAPRHSRPARTRAFWIGPMVASLAAVQPNATRARSVGVPAARSNQQGNCKSYAHQPQYSEGLSANDHDQDGRLFPVRDGRQNYLGPTAVMGVRPSSGQAAVALAVRRDSKEIANRMKVSRYKVKACYARHDQDESPLPLDGYSDYYRDAIVVVTRSFSPVAIHPLMFNCCDSPDLYFSSWFSLGNWNELC